MSMNTVRGGGTVERILKLHQALNKMSGVNSRILSIDSGIVGAPSLHEDEFTQLPCWNRRWYIPVPRVKVVNEILKWADVVHIMNHWTIINIWIYLLVRIMNKPYVICPAGSLTVFGRSKLLKKIYHFLIGRQLIKNASAGIVISKDEITALKKDGLKDEQIFHMPNGVNESEFEYTESTLVRDHTGIREHPYILFVGRLNKIKGPDVLLDAFLLTKDCIPHHLVFAGTDDGMQMQLNEFIIENNIQDRVHFIGHIEGDLKSSAYHTADLLVVPSRHEAMSIVALEAAISSTPVLLSDQCGFSELVEAGGAFETSPTALEISNGLLNVLNTPEKIKEMGIKGREYVRERFTWQHTAEQHLALFSTLVEPPHGKSKSIINQGRDASTGNRLGGLVFPFAFSLNMFSMTALLIVLGIFGEAKIAADVGIIQAAAAVVFMAFGSNARNIILSRNESITIQQFFKFRCFFLVPLALLAYFLSKGFIDIANEFVFLLLLRKCIEWIVELQISERECMDDRGYAYLYSGIQVVVFLSILISLYTGTENYILVSLFVWSISPGFQLLPFLKSMLRRDKGKYMPWAEFMPHLGSSYIIAISTYVFRILIILLAGKVLGGLLFSAYAIGGMINSVYTYALGPTLAAKSNLNSNNRNWNILKIVLITLMSLGVLIALLSTYNSEADLSETQFYYLAIGLSLIGSGIMLLAQRKRIHMIQIDKDSVFVPDVLANILIISTVPFAFYLLGSKVLPSLFLWNAILNYLIYIIPSINNKWQENSKNPIAENALLEYLNRSSIQIVILILIITPVFFQLNSNILFDSPAMIFDSAGKLTKLPLPISIFACFFGFILLINFKRCYSSAIFIFVFFVAMILSIIFTSSDNNPGELGKIILMIQFILPVFALLLGQSYIEPVNKKNCFEAIFLYTLFIIVPFEVIATLSQATGILTPYLYFFSLYQHLQYMPPIYIGLYFLAVVALHDQFSSRALILMLAPFIAIYAVLSFSTLSMVVLMSGVILSAILLSANKRFSFALSITVLIGVFVCVAMNIEKLDLYEEGTKNNMYLQHKNAYIKDKSLLNPLVAIWGEASSFDNEQYRAGLDAYEIGDYLYAYDLLSATAVQGGVNAPHAMYLVAKMYAEGLLRNTDNNKAIAWYTMSAEHGYLDAQFKLGEIYGAGLIVQKDYAKAILWYTKAAERNHREAHARLAQIHREGNGEETLEQYNIEKHNGGLKQNESTKEDNITLHSGFDEKSNINVRKSIWGHYLGSINTNLVEILFGHDKRINREVAASAHNYYLDIVYNFGVFSLLPIIALIMFTIISVFKHRHRIITSPRILGLVAIVFYSIFVDNSLKVGFRQPYPGILMFFLWGVLLANLQQHQSSNIKI